MERTTGQFWRRYWDLPEETRALADKSFQLLKGNSAHPSIQLKKVGHFWSARVGIAHRALAVEDGPDRIWVWIGGHDEYERIIKNR